LNKYVIQLNLSHHSLAICGFGKSKLRFLLLTVEPKVIKEEFLETSNQSGREINDTTDNADPIGTPARISCVVAKDTLSFLVR